MIKLLLALLKFEQQDLPYCSICGGHYPAHNH